MTVAKWRGVDRRSVNRTGAVEIDFVWQFVRDRYGAGWKSLTVECDGEVRGGIGVLNGTRTWWGEHA